MTPLNFGPLPKLQDSVAVVGYPVGGETISVTVGVVSRIEVRGCACCGSWQRVHAAVQQGWAALSWLEHVDRLAGGVMTERCPSLCRSRSTPTAAPTCWVCRSMQPSTVGPALHAARVGRGVAWQVPGLGLWVLNPACPALTRTPDALRSAAGGNSGGPVFNGRGQCVGIAFQVRGRSIPGA